MEVTGEPRAFGPRGDPRRGGRPAARPRSTREMVTPVYDRIREHGVDLRLGAGVVAIGPESVTPDHRRDRATTRGRRHCGSSTSRSPSRRAWRPARGASPGRRTPAHVRPQASSRVGDAVEKTDATDGSSTLCRHNTANPGAAAPADVIAGLERARSPRARYGDRGGSSAQGGLDRLVGEAAAGVSGPPLPGRSTRTRRRTPRIIRRGDDGPARCSTPRPTRSAPRASRPQCRQAHRRHRHRDHRGPHRERAGRPGARLRAGLLFGQADPAEHAWPRRRATCAAELARPAAVARAADAVAAGAVVVDVRDTAERTEAGVIPEAVYIPLNRVARSPSTRSWPGRSSCTARRGARYTAARGSWAQHGDVRTDGGLGAPGQAGIWARGRACRHWSFRRPKRAAPADSKAATAATPRPCSAPPAIGLLPVAESPCEGRGSGVEARAGSRTTVSRAGRSAPSTSRFPYQGADVDGVLAGWDAMTSSAE